MNDGRISASMRREIWDRAGGCCEYCRSQARFAMQPFAVEHVEPRSRAGDSTLANLALACQGCNNHKYTHIAANDVVTGRTVSLFHPRRHRWDEHFIWNDDATLIIGLTPIGRATVEAMKRNRGGLVNLRRILFAAGEHPPAGREDNQSD